MNKTFFSRAFFVITLLMVPLSALTHSNFYRAGEYRSEPRYDRNCLTTFDVKLMGGSTKKSRNSNGKKAELLDVYGYQDFSTAFTGVPNPSGINTPLSNLIDYIRNQPLSNKGENYANLSYAGKFKYFGAEFQMTQNYCNGFFSEITIPVHRLQITDVSYTDKTADADKNPEWNRFLAQYAALLSAYNISAGNTKETCVGDITMLAGWTYNDDTSDILDFLDVTIKAGLSVPTAHQKKATKVFSIAGGNNGHVGIPVSFDMAIGMYEWFTWGMHVGGQFFLKHDNFCRMKTNPAQNGFIKFGAGYARQDLGNIWDIGSFVKADHIAHGLSLMVGYNYTSQEDTTLKPYNTTLFTQSIVNNDEVLKKWRMHTINVMAEYDFAQEDKALNPKVGVFFNMPVSGKRVFNTKVFGGNTGLNITWNF